MRWGSILAATMMTLATIASGWAEMTIKLKDGTVYQLPIEPEQIQSIELTPGSKKSIERSLERPGKPKSPAERAAAQEGRTVKPAAPDSSTERQTAEVPADGVFRIGPTRKFTRPSQVSKLARDGAVIEIDAGTYSGDAAVWQQNDLTLRGVGGRAHLKADGAQAGGKGIWVIRGSKTVVENIEFSGAKVADKNGAGIRLDRGHLTIRGSYFHDNENGLFVANNKDIEVVIENSEFAHNGGGQGQTHNIYIGAIRSFTLRNSYVHHSRIGHNVKTRAYHNAILYNFVADEEEGSGSYAIDLQGSGSAYVIGNILHQGPNSPNRTLINYGRPNASNPEAKLYLANNTLVIDGRGACSYGIGVPARCNSSTTFSWAREFPRKERVS